MKTTFFLLTIACLTVLGGALEADEPLFPLISFTSDPPDDGKLAGIISDRQENVWAYADDEESRIYRLINQEWEPININGLSESSLPQGLAVHPARGVYALWQVADSEKWMVVHATTDSAEVVVKFSDPPQEPTILGTSDGFVISGKGRRIFRESVSRNRFFQRDLPDSAFVANATEDEQDKSLKYLPISAFEDKQGKIWLWNARMSGSGDELKLRKPLYLLPDQDAIGEMTLPDIEEAHPISLIGDGLEDRTIFATAGKGLILVSKDGESHQTLDDSQMHYIERQFEVEGIHFMITTPQPDEFEWFKPTGVSNLFSYAVHQYYDSAVDGSRLFQTVLEDSGEYSICRRITKFDEEPYFGWIDRPIVPEKSGFWTSSSKRYLTFVPLDVDSEITFIKEGYGFPLKSLDQLVAAGPDHLVAFSRGSGKTCLAPRSLTKIIQSYTRPAIEYSTGNSRLVQGKDKRIYGFRQESGFSVWYEGTWHPWEHPEELDDWDGIRLSKSEGDLLWVFNDLEGPIAVFSMSEHRWEVFERFQEALVKRLGLGSRIDYTQFPIIFPFASQSSPKRVAYVDLSGTLHYFDGENWNAWEIEAIQGDDNTLTHVPFFDDKGRLTLPAKKSFRLDASGNWNACEVPTQHMKSMRDFIYPVQEHVASVPVEGRSTSITDRSGVTWVQTHEGVLYRGVPAFAMPIESHQSPLPNCEFMEVFDDGERTTFIRCSRDDRDIAYLIIQGQLPKPSLSLSVAEAKLGRAKIDVEGASILSWRLNGGDWAPIREVDRIEYNQLVPGPYQLEVRAYNRELVPANQSFGIEFEIHALDAEEILRIAHMIKDASLEKREEFAAALRAQGEPAVKFLEDAMSNSNDGTTNWWIRSVLQRIEEDAKLGELEQ